MQIAYYLLRVKATGVFFALKLSRQYNQSVVWAGFEKIVCDRISKLVKPAPTKNIPTKPDKQLLRANRFYQL